MYFMYEIENGKVLMASHSPLFLEECYVDHKMNLGLIDITQFNLDVKKFFRWKEQLPKNNEGKTIYPIDIPQYALKNALEIKNSNYMTHNPYDYLKCVYDPVLDSITNLTFEYSKEEVKTFLTILLEAKEEVFYKNKTKSEIDSWAVKGREYLKWKEDPVNASCPLLRQDLFNRNLMDSTNILFDDYMLTVVEPKVILLQKHSTVLRSIQANIESLVDLIETQEELFGMLNNLHNTVDVLYSNLMSQPFSLV